MKLSRRAADRLKNTVSGWSTGMHSRVPTFVKNGIKSYTHVSEELGQRPRRMEKKRNGQPWALGKGPRLPEQWALAPANLGPEKQ